MPHLCPACGSAVDQHHDVGRPRLYCSATCRSRASKRRLSASRTAEAERASELLAALSAVMRSLPED